MAESPNARLSHVRIPDTALVKAIGLCQLRSIETPYGEAILCQPFIFNHLREIDLGGQ